MVQRRGDVGGVGYGRDGYPIGHDDAAPRLEASVVGSITKTVGHVAGFRRIIAHESEDQASPAGDDSGLHCGIGKPRDSSEHIFRAVLHSVPVRIRTGCGGWARESALSGPMGKRTGSCTEVCPCGVARNLVAGGAEPSARKEVCA